MTTVAFVSTLANVIFATLNPRRDWLQLANGVAAVAGVITLYLRVAS